MMYSMRMESWLKTCGKEAEIVVTVVIPPDFDGVGDYEDYHWLETYPTKRHCLDAVISVVDHGVTW